MPDIAPVPWVGSLAELETLQAQLGAASLAPWAPTSGGPRSVAACFVCFPRPAKALASERSSRDEARCGAAGDTGWAAAALFQYGKLAATVVVRGVAAAAYNPGHLALREGPLLEAAVRALPERPEILLVNATGRDHPRRAGLALHLGERLGLPSIGATNRLLVATGAWPEDEDGAISPFHLGGEIVGSWLRVRRGVRPLAIHAAWRTDPSTALAAVRACTARRARTPAPLRAARRAARQARDIASQATR